MRSKLISIFISMFFLFSIIFLYTVMAETITISNVYPSDGGDSVISPTLSIYINNNEDNSMDVSWYEGNYTNINSLGTVSVSTGQGVCTDGTYLYTTSTDYLYKYTMGGSYVDSEAEHNYGTFTHNGDCCHLNGIIYVARGDVTGERDMCVEWYYASNLTFGGRHEFTNNEHYEACSLAYHEINEVGYWWFLVGSSDQPDPDDKHMIRLDYDFDWTSKIEYDNFTDGYDDNLYNGLAWYGDDIICTNHDTTDGCERYRYNYNTQQFDFIKHYSTTTIDQGCDYYQPDDILWALASGSSVRKNRLTGYNLLETDSSVGDGTQTCAFDNATCLDFTYYWNVTVEGDSITSYNEYSFTVRPIAVTNVNPMDGSNSSASPDLSFTVTNHRGNSMNLYWYDCNYTSIDETYDYGSTHADQGVCSDDNFIYTTSSTTLYCYWKSNSTQKYAVSLTAYNWNHNGDCCYYNGTIYIGACNYPSASPRYTKIIECDADTGSYEDSYTEEFNSWCGGVDVHEANGNLYVWILKDNGGNSWLCRRDFDTYANPVNYTLSYNGNSQGIVWRGNDIYISHDHTSLVDRYHWTGSSFSQVKQYSGGSTLPTGANQGLDFHKGYFYFAQRDHSGSDDYVCQGELTGINPTYMHTESGGNGSYDYTWTDALEWGTIYYWNLSIDDGEEWRNLTYSFMIGEESEEPIENSSISSISIFTAINDRSNNSIIEEHHRWFNWTRDENASIYSIRIADNTIFTEIYLQLDNITVSDGWCTNMFLNLSDSASPYVYNYWENATHCFFYLPYYYNITEYGSKYYQVRSYTTG